MTCRRSNPVRNLGSFVPTLEEGLKDARRRAFAPGLAPN